MPVQRTKSLTKLGDSHNGEEKKHHMKVKKSEKLHNGNHAPATTTTDSSTQYDDTRKSSSAQWDMSFAQPVSVGTTCTLDDEEKHAEKHVATDEEN